jgi:cellulose 1,4-beta-cellobiosidase
MTGAWTLSQANFDMPAAGPPAAYPSIFRGCHWGACTRQSGLPIRVGKLRTATSSWATTEAPSGAYDVTYDLWTNSTPTTSGAPNGSEIMIWLNSLGGVRPVGRLAGTVNMQGATWKVYRARRTGWNAVTYERTIGTAIVTDLDLRAFIQDSVKRGATKPSWYLLDAEAGFEIWQGGEGLASESFGFSATS